MSVQDDILGRGASSAPTPSATSMTMQELMHRADEVDQLRRDIDAMRGKLRVASMEVLHWRRFALDKGIITEADYDRISRGH